MPIRPEERSRYPKDWAAISRRIRFERAAGKCEWPGCEARHGESHPVTGSKVVLTVAHLNHEPEDVRESNLAAWCQLHHNAYDAANRRAGIRERYRLKVAVGDLWDSQP